MRTASIVGGDGAVRAVLLGGGPWAARVIERCAERPVAGRWNWRLVARNAERLDDVVHHARSRAVARRPEWTVDPYTEWDAALDGATLVIVMIRVGGLEGRIHDEEFPLEYGCVGDEGVGLGGLANTWRTVPVVAELGARLLARAPAATVVNLTAPLGAATRALHDAGVVAFGLCELPTTTERALLANDDPELGEACLEYLGVNHLGWFWPSDDLSRRALARAVERGILDASTFEQYGAAPLSYFDRVFGAEARVAVDARAPGRARRLAELRKQCYGALRRNEPVPWSGRAMPWIDEAIVPLLESLVGGAPGSVFLTRPIEAPPAPLPGGSWLESRANLPDLAARVPRGPMPRAVGEFLGRVAASESLAYRASRERRIDLMAQALEALPLRIVGDPNRALRAITDQTSQGVSV